MGDREEEGVVSAVHRLALILSVVLIPALGALSAAAPAVGAAPTVIVVAPLADEVGMQQELVRWAAMRLSVLLSAARFQVVPLDQTERVFRQMGLRPADLIGLSRPVELGARLGAEAVITGRLTRLDLDPPGSALVPPVVTRKDVKGPPEAFLVLDLRVLQVPTRRVLLWTEASGQGTGVFRVRIATERALADFLRQLQNLP